MPLPNDASVKDIIDNLQELTGINQKAELAAILGSPSLSTDTMPKLVSDLQARKNELETAVISKGGTVTGNPPTVAELVAGIEGIATSAGNLDTLQAVQNAMKTRNYNNEDYRQLDDGGYVEYVTNRNGYSGSALRFYNVNGVLTNTIPLSIPFSSIISAHLIDKDELQVSAQHNSIRRYNFKGVLIGSVTCSFMNRPFCAIYDAGLWRPVGFIGDGMRYGTQIYTTAGIWISSINSDDTPDQYSYIRRLSQNVYILETKRNTVSYIVINQSESKYIINSASFGLLLGSLGRR